MDSFRFVHTADIHLDSPLQGLTQYDGTVIQRIRSATRHAFINLIDRVIDEEVAFVVIAGDLYDGNWKDYNTGYTFIEQMARLDRAGISVYIVYGNHDAESQITKKLRLPSNVYSFPSRTPKTKNIPDLNVSIHGQSYSIRDVTKNLSRNYPKPVPGTFNIGVLHTALSGYEGHANYAPCVLQDLVDRGYQYWALGHVHNRQVLRERPHIVFPGNLQGRNIREAGTKSASLVSVANDEVTEINEWECDVVRWHRLSIDISGSDSLANVHRTVTQRMEEYWAQLDESRVQVLRIQLTGTTDIHGLLFSSIEEIRAESRATAIDINSDSLWVEDVKLLTTRPTNELEAISSSNLIGDIDAIVAEGLKDPDLLERLKSELSQIKLPSPVKSGTESDVIRALVDEDVKTLLEEASNQLISQLSKAE